MTNTNQNPGVQNYQFEEYGNINHENFDKFLSFLPREKGWRHPYIYQFQGFWLPPNVLQSVLSCQNHFQAQDSDIILNTFPKCGTTWLKALIFAIINRNEHSPLSQEHPLLTKNPHALVPYLEMDLYVANNNPDLSSFTTPRLLATHASFGLLPKSVLESKCKLVYICRNPKDTFVSFWCFAEKSRFETHTGVCSLEEAFDMFCKGCNFFGPYWDHVLDCWKASLENPDKVLFMIYEELQREPTLQVRRLAEFLGYLFLAEEEDSGMVEAIVKLCSFKSLKSLEVNNGGSTKLITGVENKALFRKGEVGDWENHLSVEMANQIDMITEQKFQGSGLLELNTGTFSEV